MGYAIRETIKPCPNRCQLNITPWGLDEHKKICPEQKIPCIYRENGCSQNLTRSQLATHLPVCTSQPEKDLMGKITTDSMVQKEFSKTSSHGSAKKGSRKNNITTKEVKTVFCNLL